MNAALALAILLCQIPPSEKLPPDEDEKEFRAEIHRLEEMLKAPADSSLVQYALARTWAAGGQYREAMNSLEKVAALKVGLDPSNDHIFSKLKPTREYQALLEQIRKDTPPIQTARHAFTMPESDLVPEGIAYDPKTKRFLLGSTAKHKIVSCTIRGSCQTLVPSGRDGLHEVLGLRVDPRDGSLWAASNSDSESALFHFQVPSGKLIRKYRLDHRERPHVANDLVVDTQGNVFLTDTSEGTPLYWLPRNADRLEIFNPDLKVTSANGIAISSAPAPKLYVASFPDGITVVDIASRTFHAIAHPADLCLASIDGLYFFNGSLYAIQNGIMVHRVVRLRLNRDLNAITSFDILERRNPIFDGGPTTAAIAGDQWYFVANPQLDTPSGALFHPLQVLRINTHRAK